jgi:hypothetical protein
MVNAYADARATMMQMQMQMQMHGLPCNHLSRAAATYDLVDYNCVIDLYPRLHVEVVTAISDVLPTWIRLQLGR